MINELPGNDFNLLKTKRLGDKAGVVAKGKNFIQGIEDVVNSTTGTRWYFFICRRRTSVSLPLSNGVLMSSIIKQGAASSSVRSLRFERAWLPSEN